VRHCVGAAYAVVATGKSRARPPVPPLDPNETASYGSLEPAWAGRRAWVDRIPG
jgi:hypothetical protein